MNNKPNFSPKISKSLLEVWEWKEKAAANLLEISPDQWAEYIQNKTQVIIDEMKSRKTIKK